MALANVWLSRITTVVLEMLLPGLAGHWLDQRWGTNFLILVGLVFGLTLGIWHLLVMTGAVQSNDRPGDPPSSI